RLTLAAAGSWTADQARRLEPLVERETRRSGSISRVDIDMGGIERLDTFGAWLIERLQRAFKSRGAETALTGLRDDYRGLVEEMQGIDLDSARSAPRAGSLTVILGSIGQSMADIGRSMTAMVNMLGAVSTALLRVLVRPRSLRLTSLVHHLDNVGWRAVPIILLITFLIGCIIAQQGIFHFRKFGADIFVVDMVGILVLREIG